MALSFARPWLTSKLHELLAPWEMGTSSTPLTILAINITLPQTFECHTIIQASTTPGAHVHIVFDPSQPCFTRSFDLVVAQGLAHGYADPSTILRYLFGCVRPGGRLYVGDFGQGTLYEARYVEGATLPSLTFNLNHHRLTSFCKPSSVIHQSEAWVCETKGGQSQNTYHLLYGVFEKENDFQDE